MTGLLVLTTASNRPEAEIGAFKVDDLGFNRPIQHVSERICSPKANSREPAAIVNVYGRAGDECPGNAHGCAS